MAVRSVSLQLFSPCEPIHESGNNNRFELRAHRGLLSEGNALSVYFSTGTAYMAVVPVHTLTCIHRTALSLLGNRFYGRSTLK